MRYWSLTLMLVLPRPVPVKSLQTVPWRDPQRPKRDCGVQLIQLALRDAPELLGARPSCRLGPAPVEHILGPSIMKGSNHLAPASTRTVEL